MRTVSLTALCLGVALSAGSGSIDLREPPGESAGPPAPIPPANPETRPEAASPPGSISPATTSKPASEAEPEVQLFLVDGRRFTGFLLERNASEYILRIAGIKTPFKAGQVERCVVLPPIVERYRELRKAIDENDGDQVLRLVDWLTARQQLDLALTELDALLKRQPENSKAARARTNVLRLIDLRNKAAKPKDAVTGEGESDSESSAPLSPPMPPAGELPSFPYLSEPQITAMKVYEIDLTNPPRVEVPRETITALLEQHGGHPAIPSGREGREGLYLLPAREQLELLFRVRARDLYTQVRVLDQPDTMRRFRDEVQRTWLLPQCSTTACHGGTEAGRLILSTRRPNSDATMYTNFYILQQFRLADGTPLLNFDEPDKSPLLQFALPREDAQVKHPRVLRGIGKDAWKPAFRSRDDPRLIEAIEWLKNAYRPRPDYGITYIPARPFTADQAKRPDPGR